MPVKPVEDLTVHQAIGRIIEELEPIGKNQRNKEQNYAFRGIDDVLKSIHPLFAKYGVFVAPSVIERQYEERLSARGNVGHCAHLHVKYKVYGPKGDYIEASTWGEGLDYSDKATNKAMTAAFKYLLFELFAICDPSEDSDSTTEEGGKTHQSRREESGAKANEEPPAYTELQEKVRAHPRLQAMRGPALTEFVTDAIGYANPGLRNLTDEDCEHLLARLEMLDTEGAS